jgi:hypothetical protein
MLLAMGCGGQTGKAINKDKDKPVPEARGT